MSLSSTITSYCPGKMTTFDLPTHWGRIVIKYIASVIMLQYIAGDVKDLNAELIKKNEDGIFETQACF